MPSFSKDCFGGFEGFQKVTIDANEKWDSPNFWLLGELEESAAPARRVGIAEGDIERR
jgi:hypothetical protein